MSSLTPEMKRLVEQERLGFYATVCADGTPNVSPKGTTYVLDDDHLFFADVRSPQTVENVRAGSWVELNVVDPIVRKGYRFKGPAAAHDPGSEAFDLALAQMRAGGSGLTDRVKTIVVVEVREARPLVSPAYDGGSRSEAEIAAIYRARYAAHE